MQMIRTIQLHGILKDKFGEYFELDVSNCREATHALASQIKEFKQFMLEADKNNLKFAVFADDKNVTEDELDNHTSASTIHIVPKIIGAGGDAGLFQLIGGIALVAVGVFTANPYLTAMGASLAIGGIASYLMPMPTLDNSNEPEGNKASNGFGGAVTTVGQGNPVPVLYGTRDIGGFIATASIYTEDTQ